MWGDSSFAWTAALDQRDTIYWISRTTGAFLDSATFLQIRDSEQLMFHCLFLADIHWECQALCSVLYLHLLYHPTCTTSTLWRRYNYYSILHISKLRLGCWEGGSGYITNIINDNIRSRTQVYPTPIIKLLNIIKHASILNTVRWSKKCNMQGSIRNSLSLGLMAQSTFGLSRQWKISSSACVLI